MFTGLEAQNRAQQFTVTVDVKAGNSQADIAEALRVIADRIDLEVSPQAGLLGFADVGDEKKTAHWQFGKGVRD